MSSGKKFVDFSHSSSDMDRTMSLTMGYDCNFLNSDYIAIPEPICPASDML